MDGQHGRRGVGQPQHPQEDDELVGCGQNGVNANGAAAEVMHFDRLGTKVRPGTLGKIKVG